MATNADMKLGDVCDSGWVSLFYAGRDIESNVYKVTAYHDDDTVVAMFALSMDKYRKMSLREFEDAIICKVMPDAVRKWGPDVKPGISWSKASPPALRMDAPAF